MSIFPQDLIDQVSRQLDPRAVLARIDYRTETIQDAGPVLKCFCPIHEETIFRTLIVEKDARSYRCSNYRCPGHGGGDLIDLYSKARKIGYEQALLELAEAFQIQVDLSLVDQYLQNTLEVARNYLELGALDEAEETYGQILRFKSDCRPALEGLARIYEQSGRG